jgi:cell division protease FtsH
MCTNIGLRQLSELTPVDRRRIAYHEAGHTRSPQYYLMDRYFPAFVTIHLAHGGLEGAAAFAHASPQRVGPQTSE